MFASFKHCFPLCSMVALLLCPTVARCQLAEEQWEAMCVFFDAQYVDQSVTDAYSPVPFEQLEKDLAAVAARRRAVPWVQRGVSEAVYIAALVDDRLVSEQSVWRMRPVGQQAADYANLGLISFSPLRARSQQQGQRQLADIDRYLATGALVVADDPEYPEIVFGFTSLETSRASRQFEMQVPAASIARMYVAVPADTEVSSDEATAEPVDARDVPFAGDSNDYSTFGQGDSQWWLLTCSGLQDFNIKLQRRPTVQGVPHVLVPRGEVNYQVDASQVELSASFDIAPSAVESPIRLAIDSQLKILEVDIDGIAIDWHALLVNSDATSVGQDQQTLVELNATLLECGGKTISVRAVAPHDPSSSLSLPQACIDGGYCVSGQTRIVSQSGILISSLFSADRIFDANVNDISQLRTVVWMGTPPALTADLVVTSRVWNVDSLTRFSIQPEWLSATCRARVSTAGAKTNMLTFRIDRSWLVDSVRIIGDAAGRLRTNLRQMPGTQRWLVDVTWEDNPVDLQFDIEVAAHSPRNTRAERLSLRPNSLLTLAGARQNDYLVVEPSGQYRVEITRLLLSLQVQPIDLPAWQREELGSESEGAWIFVRPKGNAPPVRLFAYRGTYVANIVSVAQMENIRQTDADLSPQASSRKNRDDAPGQDAAKQDAAKQEAAKQEAAKQEAAKQEAAKQDAEVRWQVVSNIECRPISGAVGSVSCVLPSSIEPENVEWLLLDSASELDSMRLAVEAVARGTGDARLLTIVLPAPTTQSFTLQARIPVPQRDATFELPVLAVSSSIGGSSTLLLPPELSLQAGSSGLQILPDASSLSDPRYDLLLAGQSAEQRSQYVVSRVDAAASHLLPATALAQTEGQEVWILEQTIEHRALAGVELQHNAKWTVLAGAAGKFKVALPVGWHVQSLRVNGETRDIAAGESGELEVAVPSNANSVVEMGFSSMASGGTWMRNLVLQQPVVEAPVVSAKRFVSIPPSFTTFGHWSLVGRGETLMDRVLPRMLWKILAPRSKDDPVASWAMIELSDLQGNPVATGTGSEPNFERINFAILSRSALAAFAIAFVLFCIGLMRCCAPPSFGYWFGLCLLAMAAVLLVPASILPVAQLVLLSACCAFCLRLLQPVFQYRNNADVGTSGPRSRSMRSVIGTLLAMTVPFSAANAQPIESGGGEPATVKTYGLLIPTTETEDGVEVAGSYAYVPKELLALLRQADGGGQSDRQPHITAADYQLRLRRNALTDVTRVSDFKLDLGVVFPAVTSELVLPFEDPNVVLTGAIVGGQSVAPGGRVVQEPGQIVVRPGTVGEVDVQLQFAELSPIEEQGWLSLQIGIPPLPIATLRVVTDGQQDFEIDSIGPIQRSMASTLARIGQLEALKVRWIDSGRIGNETPQPLQLQAQAWLHADGSSLVAASRLLINGSLPASGEISVVLDPGWVPVGDQWGDARVIDSSLVALGTGISYQLQCSPQRDDPNRCEVSVLLVPKNLERANTLRAPFLLLQGSSQLERVFFWSAELASDWRPEELAFWQPSDASELPSWRSLTLSSTQPVAFQATAEASTPAARRQAVTRSAEVVVSEETHLHIGESESQVDYAAKFETAIERGQLSLMIPGDCTVRGVQIDGMDVDTFAVGDWGGGNILVIDSPATSIASIAVQADLRTRLEVLTNMPRITLSNVKASSSRYYVFRGPGLDCQLESVPELSFTPFDVPASRLLQGLESAVAALELGDRYRSVDQLPSKYRVSRRVSSGRLQTLQKIARTEDGWQETLYCVWDGLKSPLDIVCVEIPARLRDVIDLGSLSRRYVPTGDADTLTLCILPPPPENSRVIIAMRFPIATASSNQTLGLENIKVLDAEEAGSFIALPSELRAPGSTDPLPVRWTKVGREIPSSGLVNLLGQGPWKVYQTLGRQTQASWLTRGSVQSGRVLRERVEFTMLDSQGLTALVSYWVDPAGQTNFSAEIPRGCRLLAVRSGDRIVDWHLEEKANQASSVDVLLQPNYLPTHLSMLLKFDTVEKDAINVMLPQVNMEGAGRNIDVVNKVAGYIIREPIAGGNERARTRAQQWVELLAEAVPTLSGLAEDEVNEWLDAWHPREIGISADTVIQQPSLSQNGDTESSGSTAIEYWRAIGEELGSSLPESIESPHPVRASSIQEQLVALSETRELILNRVESPSNRIPRLVAAGSLALILALVLVLRLRIGSAYTAVLAHNPWLYWMQLGGVLLIILPVIWPAAVMCLLATSSAVAQWLDQWKRRRAGLLSR